MGTMVAVFFGRLFTDGWLGARRLVNRAGNHQLVGIITARWTETIRGTDPAEWRVEQGRFVAGSRKVFTDDRRRLVFDDGNGAVRVALPKEITCAFAAERPEGLAPCAVMNVMLASRYFHTARTNAVRIVACSGGAP